MFRRKLFLFLCIFLLSISAQAFETEAKYAALIDTETNTLLYQKNAHIPMTPSSMTKLMTLYIVFDQLSKNMLTLDDTLHVSKKAWKKGGSKMFVPYNKKVRLEDLIKGIAVQSGNDACIVIAEHISGDEAYFALLMNQTAKQLGLTHSHFKNATGWPDAGHEMSAYDIATLSKKLVEDFPEYYHYFGLREFTYSKIKQYNRNLLLRDNAADGLKTGHTEDAGYGIAVSAKRNNQRLVAVVNGLSSKEERALSARNLLDYGFRHFEPISVAKAGDTIGTAKTWFGKKKRLQLSTHEDIDIIIPRHSRDKLRSTIEYPAPIKAPIRKGDEVATLVIQPPGMSPQRTTLYAAEDVEKLGFFGHIIEAASYYTQIK